MTEMNKGERADLVKVVRLRMKVAKAAIEKLAAERKAQVEGQLATIHRADAQEWRHITEKAEAAVQEAKAEVAKVCDARGIPKAFQPSLSLSWWGRGENAARERRVEIRKTAFQKIDADKRVALMAVEAWGCERLEHLHTGSLESSEAKSFFSSLPSPEMLLPEVKVLPSLTANGGLEIVAVTEGGGEATNGH